MVKVAPVCSGAARPQAGQFRAALLHGTMSLVIWHPLARLARDAIDNMVLACANPGSNRTSIVPFEIYTRENL